MPKSFSGLNCLMSFRRNNIQQMRSSQKFCRSFFPAMFSGYFPEPLNHFSPSSPRSLIETLNFLRCSYLWEHTLILPRDYAGGTQLSLSEYSYQGSGSIKDISKICPVPVLFLIKNPASSFQWNQINLPQISICPSFQNIRNRNEFMSEVIEKWLCLIQ